MLPSSSSGPGNGHPGPRNRAVVALSVAASHRQEGHVERPERIMHILDVLETGGLLNRMTQARPSRGFPGGWVLVPSLTWPASAQGHESRGQWGLGAWRYPCPLLRQSCAITGTVVIPWTAGTSGWGWNERGGGRHRRRTHVPGGPAAAQPSCGLGGTHRGRGGRRRP